MTIPIRPAVVSAVVALVSWASTPAGGTYPTSQKGAYALGVGLSGSTVEADVPRDGSDTFTMDGWGVAGRAGLGDIWGIELTYRRLTDDESFSSGEKITAGILGAHAYIMWWETLHSHWYAKVGLAWSRFESKTPGEQDTADGALGPSIGAGVDWGSERHAFFIDFDATFVDIEIVRGDKESYVAGATLIGYIVKF